MRNIELLMMATITLVMLLFLFLGRGIFVDFSLVVADKIEEIIGVSSENSKEVAKENDKEVKNDEIVVLQPSYYEGTLLSPETVSNVKVDENINSFLKEFYIKLQGKQYIELKDYVLTENELKYLDIDNGFVDYKVLNVISTENKDKHFVTIEVNLNNNIKNIQQLILYPYEDTFKVSFSNYINEATQYLNLFDEQSSIIYSFLNFVQKGEWSKAIPYLADDISKEDFIKLGLTDAMIQKTLGNNVNFKILINEFANKSSSRKMKNVLLNLRDIVLNPFVIYTKNEESYIDGRHTFKAQEGTKNYSMTFSNALFDNYNDSTIEKLYVHHDENNKMSLYIDSTDTIFPSKEENDKPKSNMPLIFILITIGAGLIFFASGLENTSTSNTSIRDSNENENTTTNLTDNLNEVIGEQNERTQNDTTQSILEQAEVQIKDDNTNIIKEETNRTIVVEENIESKEESSTNVKIDSKRNIQYDEEN